MNSDNQQVFWTPKDHRSFAAAVFDDGICKASPAVILDNMSCLDGHLVTIAKVKSRLQKYRANKGRNREEFLASYDTWTNKVMRIIGDLKVPRGTNVTAHDWRAQNYHLVFQLRALMNPEHQSLGETAACLSFRALMQDKLSIRSAALIKLNSFPAKNSIGEKVNQLSHLPVGRLLEYKSVVYPELTKEEKLSPLGLCLESTKQLLSAVSILASSQRQVQSPKSQGTCDQNNDTPRMINSSSSHGPLDLFNNFRLFGSCINQSSWASESRDFTGNYESTSQAIFLPQTSNTQETAAKTMYTRRALDVPPDATYASYSVREHADRYANTRKRRREAICMPLSPLPHAEPLQSIRYVEGHSTRFVSTTGFDEYSTKSRIGFSSEVHPQHADAHPRVEKMPEASNVDGPRTTHFCSRRSHHPDEHIYWQQLSMEAITNSSYVSLSNNASSQSRFCFHQRSSSISTLTEFDGFDMRDHFFPDL